MTREMILIVAVVFDVALIVFAILMLNKLEDNHVISKGKKNILVIITLLIPPLGFILTYMTKKNGLN